MKRYIISVFAVIVFAVPSQAMAGSEVLGTLLLDATSKTGIDSTEKRLSETEIKAKNEQLIKNIQNYLIEELSKSKIIASFGSFFASTILNQNAKVLTFNGIVTGKVTLISLYFLKIPNTENFKYSFADMWDNKEEFLSMSHKGLAARYSKVMNIDIGMATTPSSPAKSDPIKATE